MTEPRKGAGRPLGPTGESVRANIRRIRDQKKISGPELSARLSQLGRDIPAIGIQRIESGARRVDVDDLVAIALALNVPPVVLLMPEAVEATDLVRTTGLTEDVEAQRIWDWLGGDAAPPQDPSILAFLGPTTATMFLVGAHYPRWVFHRKEREHIVRQNAAIEAALGRGTSGDD